MKSSDHKELALQSFLKKDFVDAMKNYALVLSHNPSDKEARIGAILSDMALDNESEAVALFEYYLATKDDQDSEETIESIIKTFDDGLEYMSEITTTIDSITNDEEERLIYQNNGISYDDFTTIIESRGGFKEAYQDIIYSSKVVITKKDDFLDFINNLIESGFKDVALNYLESASSVFIADSEVERLFDKINSMGKY
jgi:tetratricopeptide (TPR) repeat protein